MYKIDTYAVMGNPVTHSKSPQIHTLFAKQTQQKLQYKRIEVPLDQLQEKLQSFQDQGGKGLNITVPFKQQAYALMQECSEAAQQASAVNTILFKADGSMFGDNTDGYGLIRDITINNKFYLEGKKVLLVGAGGACHAVLPDLLRKKPAKLIIVNRTAEKAVQLADKFKEFAEAKNVATLRGCGFDELGKESFHLIINGTSASLEDQLPPIPSFAVVPAFTFCYDMAYGNKPTVFQEWAKRQGASKSLDGLGMLVEQAAQAFFLWRGVRPDSKPVIEAMRSSTHRKVTV